MLKFGLMLSALLVVPMAGAQSVNGSGTTKPFRPSQLLTPSGGVCPPGPTTLCIPLDDTFSVPSMDATGGSGEATPGDPCQRNDDDSTLAMPLQFSFDLFGTAVNEVYINNNGNVSFGGPFSTFSASGFPVNGFPMLAPFWGDVDTGDVNETGGGVVYFKSEANRFTVIWEHVGYFNQQYDRLNTFELIMTDGTDPLIGIGNNVCFCYDDMSWTTGDASGGVGGLGGIPATVGANQGNGVDFFLVGLFDTDTDDYDGPGGANDGVGFLTDNTICFSTGNSDNIPPILTEGPDGNKVFVTENETVVFNLSFISPEVGQTTAITVNSGGLANFSCEFTPGNPATAVCTFSPDSSQLGVHTVSFTATDDFAPNPQSTTVPIDLCVNEATECFLMLGFNATAIPLPFSPEDTLYVEPLFIFPVTLENIPVFAIPNSSALLGFHLYGQLYMDNAIIFPNDQYKMSNGVDVTLGRGYQTYGTSTGMQCWLTELPLLGGELKFDFSIDS